MDYEKAYKEALERAKAGKPMDEVFPELKESEDERIRKKMIEHFKSKTKDTWCNMPVKSILAWLKKKKEQPSTVDDIAAAYQLGLADGRKEQKPAMIQWTGKNLKEVIDFTGKSPKFEEWFKSWDEYEKYVHSHNDILKLFYEDGRHYEVPIGAWIVKTPDGYNVPSVAKFVQKPAEWSDEDEDAIEMAIIALEDMYNEDEPLTTYGGHNLPFNVAADRLKSLRPQPSLEAQRGADENSRQIQ